MAPAQRPVILTILDGWGINPNRENNAAALADTPFLDGLFQRYPNSRLEASGLAVGLPEGQMGNSEVGHLNIGAGRVVYQDLTRITKSISDGDFFTNAALCEAMDRTKSRGGDLHLMGLLSDGGVHSLNSHLYALVKLAKDKGIKKVYIHAFMDGRDTPPRSGATYLQQLEEQLQQLGTGTIATISGRFYAMDRDQRWERVEQAYRAMVERQGNTFASSAAAIQASYANDVSDEFIVPCLIEGGKAVSDDDGMIFFNFRADRAREISRAFTTDDFDGFCRQKKIDLAHYVCMTEYDEHLKLPVAFPTETYPNILAQTVAAAGLKQLHIAETEKYAHVTFFFNGGNETSYTGEDRILVPSPKEVATYDLKPQMSAEEVSRQVTEQIRSHTYDLIILNFANPDMVGHTGILSAAITAMETVDHCVQQVVETALDAGGCLLITADHGNCEQMADASGSPHTAHTSNPVPLLYVSEHTDGVSLQPGKLADLAPTLLQLLNLPQPVEMTGHSLLSNR
ncbi:2,3-bisphosphoglycerate-independent phosphoglycerate mutase [uncultured Desulfuromonas sp.]|uniref:2,3-bisphosphoglycerate-independent phosphoglycerate mutase n=1 Tax=uncultured Desulfuromonas sp. TaxID=181013 RepID=UPI002AAB2D1A|nr:2,3-bisphosphoglycerate-independent phosphoglycerate mutase [uncultured Desulfuromonas sp.]